MSKIKAVIIDDEPPARASLSALLETYCPNVTLIGSASAIPEARTLIKKMKPDLVFLDIALGEESGFDLLSQLDLVDFAIIITAMHSECAVKAFRVNALDYLLKPIVPEQLKTAVGKVNLAPDHRQLQQQLSALTKSIEKQVIDQLVLHAADGITFIAFRDIVRIEGNGNYSTFFLNDDTKVVASKNLGHFENILPGEYFFRCHQSHLINLHFVRRISTVDGAQINLKNGATVPLTHKRKQELMLRSQREIR